MRHFLRTLREFDLDSGSTTRPEEGRNSRIDVLRGISILLVMLHHYSIAYPLNGSLLSAILGWEIVGAITRNGNYGVTIFFVISGYVITSNVYRRHGELDNIDARAFYWFRIARLVPCLLLLLVIVNGFASAGVGTFQTHAAGASRLAWLLVNLASLTFWMNVLIGTYGWINYPLGVLWSLSVEEVFYLSFPFCAFRFPRKRACWYSGLL